MKGRRGSKKAPALCEEEKVEGVEERLLCNETTALSKGIPKRSIVRKISGRSTLLEGLKKDQRGDHFTRTDWLCFKISRAWGGFGGGLGVWGWVGFWFGFERAWEKGYTHK